MSAEALIERGNALYRQGDVAGAIASYEAAARADPRSARARYNLAVVLQGAARVDDAIKLYAQIPSESPEFAKAMVNWGNALKDRGELRSACDRYCRALEAKPGDEAALGNLGRLGELVLEDAQRRDAAYVLGKAATHGSADGHAGLGALAAERGELEAAVERFRQALAIEPRHVTALYNLGVALQKLGRPADALEPLREAARLDPRHVSARVSWGEALRLCNRPEEAIAQFRAALEIEPDQPLALNNMATAALDRGELDEAEALFRRLVDMKVDYAQPRFNLGIIALHRQRFAQGWEGYEDRFEVFPDGLPRPLAGIPRFELSRSSEYQRVAVLKEQGIGDQLLFSTLLPELSARGVRAVVEVDSRLVGAYRRGLPGLAFVTSPEAPRAFAGSDAQLPMGSLPGILRPSKESFGAQPDSILSADAGRIVALTPRRRAARRLGIAWRSFQSGSRHNVQARKSIPLECFARLAGDTELLDLQYGDVGGERAAFDRDHPGCRVEIDGLDRFNDLEGMLAAIESCDLVVTASNVTAHLAGAIGKATWLVYLGANPVFHYWVPGADGRSLWYPSVEIVTDKSWTTWEPAFEHLAQRWRARA